MQSLKYLQLTRPSSAFMVCLAASATATLAAAPPTTQPLTPAQAESLAIRTALPKQMFKIGDIYKAAGPLTDAKKRADVLEKVRPLYDNELKEFDRLAVVDPEYVATAASQHRGITVALASLDDPASLAAIQSKVSSKDLNTSLSGQCDQLKVQWSQANKDAAKQQAIAEKLEQLDRQYPTNDELTITSSSFAYAAATPEMKNDLQAAAVGMTSKRAMRLRTIAKSSETLAKLADKPMTLAGILPDGKPFTTADWKGKVILVDFWATWCGPCKAELPRVKKMYTDYHTQGLEVLGVSNDYSAKALTTFTAEGKMPWPQLFNTAAAADHEWNPITEKMGIPGIPMMFIIDKKGICRSIDGRSQMEKLIPQLLAEPGEAAVSMISPR